MIDKNLLKAIGISSGILALAGLAWVGFKAYQSYYETERAKLQVIQLRKDLYGEDPLKK